MHDHNLRKRKPAVAEAPKKVVKRAKKQVAKKVQPLNPFTMLPLELFQDILKQLPDAEYMAMKFVCRSFHAAMFYADGRQVVDLKAKARADVAQFMRSWRPSPYPSHLYNSRSLVEASRMSSARLGYRHILTNLEASYPGTLLLLTCLLCGRRKAHGQLGFCDAQFDQKRPWYRHCLDCRSPADFGYTYRRRHSINEVKVNGISVMRCGSCRRICPVPRRATRTGAEIPQHRCGQDLGLLK